MKQFEIKAQKRASFTKAAVKQLRREGKVPCVLYGNKKENIHFILDEKELKGLIYTPASFIVSVDIDGDIQLCTLHDAQFHPVTDHILHLDFLAVEPNEPVAINIPITISGSSEGVRQGGKLAVMARKLRVKGLVANLPDTINVDVTSLQIGKSIVAGDLKLDNLQILSPKATIICMVKVTRAAAATTGDGTTPASEA